MPRVLIERHGLEGLAHVDQVVDDVLEFLYREFGGRWPTNARLYHESVSAETDVTPTTAGEVQALRDMPGPFIAVVFPATGYELQVFLLFVSAVVSMALAPVPPIAAERNVQTESPNNGLSDRTNQARVNGRIPDIYGTVRSTPDLIQVPYKIFQDNVEKELSYMCIGRGAYDVDVHQIRDDTTPCEEIAGTSVEVYPPFTSPNSGDAPQLRIGNAISTPVLKTLRLQSVNGQVLQPADSGGSYSRRTIFTSPNVVTMQDAGIDFTEMFLAGDSVTIINAARTAGTYSYPATLLALFDPLDYVNGLVRVPGDVTSDWTVGQSVTISASSLHYDTATPSSGFVDINGVYNLFGLTFVPGDPLEPGDPGFTEFKFKDVKAVSGGWNIVEVAIGGAGGPGTLSRPSGTVIFDLAGTYTINTLTSTQLTLDAPATVNPDWDIMADDFGGESGMMFPTIYTSGDRWIGEFTLQSNEPIRRLIANFLAAQGLYADDGQQQYNQSVDVRLEATPVDSAGAPIGGTETFDGTVVGSSVTRSTRALTLFAELGATSNFWKVRARRVSPKNIDFVGTVVDEIKWRDLYGATPVDQAHFGDVTTVQSVTFATDGALAIKERKLNMLVTRKLRRRISGSTFTAELYATNDVATILAAIALDVRIGNRTVEEVDFDNLFDTAADIREYFGFAEAADFSYTFDADNLSFEETVTSVAAAVFCQPYRRGSVLRLFFERATDDSTMLFNHRNKVPGSEKRTDLFGGPAEGNDGIEFQYVDPADDAVVTIYLPEDRSAVNPKRFESVGVRNARQAHLLAWRAYNKLRFQTTSAQANCLAEADLLVIRERVLWADNTRSGSMDGDILGVQGLELHLSQPLPWAVGQTYTMYLQCRDRQTEAIAVTRGQSARHAVLAHPPRTPIVSDPDRYIRTTYIVVCDGDERNASPMLVDERSQPGDDGTIPMTVINYDARYYVNDADFRMSA